MISSQWNEWSSCACVCVCVCARVRNKEKEKAFAWYPVTVVQWTRRIRRSGDAIRFNVLRSAFSSFCSHEWSTFCLDYCDKGEGEGQGIEVRACTCVAIDSLLWLSPDHSRSWPRMARERREIRVCLIERDVSGGESRGEHKWQQRQEAKWEKGIRSRHRSALSERKLIIKLINKQFLQQYTCF